MTPYGVLLDVTDALWEHVQAGRNVPHDLAVVLHDGLSDVAESVAALEAFYRGSQLFQDDDAALPELDGVRERRSAALERDGNVVRLPVPASRLSGCFTVLGGGSDAA